MPALQRMPTASIGGGLRLSNGVPGEGGGSIGRSIPAGPARARLRAASSPPLPGGIAPSLQDPRADAVRHDASDRHDGPDGAGAPATADHPGALAHPADESVQRRDGILIERARDGDLDAFNLLVTAYQDQLFALVARMVPDRDQASDVVQEAFFSAYRNLAGFRGGAVKSWLARIAINGAMDLQRARRRRPVQPYPELEDEAWQPPAGEEADPERRALTHERSRALNDALARIAPDQRVAIVMYDVEGYDYAEIATVTGVSLGTVKSRIHRGRLALRALLEGRMELFRG